MERKDVYILIDGERKYQQSRHEQKVATHPHRDEDHSIADWVIYIKQHLEDGEMWIYDLEKDLALQEIRKIAALCVACMEFNETKPRNL